MIEDTLYSVDGLREKCIRVETVLTPIMEGVSLPVFVFNGGFHTRRRASNPCLVNGRFAFPRGGHAVFRAQSPPAIDLKNARPPALKATGLAPVSRASLVLLDPDFTR